MIEIVYINEENFDPEDVLSINLSTNIVMSTLDRNDVYLEENNRFYLLNKTDILFNNLKVIDNTAYIIDYNPHVKWSVPKGIDLVFTEALKKVPVFYQIYTNYTEIDNDPQDNQLLSINYNIYMDKERAKGVPKIPKGTKMLEVDLKYNLINDNNIIRGLYVIKNDFIFYEFKKHFDR